MRAKPRGRYFPYKLSRSLDGRSGFVLFWPGLIGGEPKTCGMRVVCELNAFDSTPEIKVLHLDGCTKEAQSNFDGTSREDESGLEHYRSYTRRRGKSVAAMWLLIAMWVSLG